MQTKGAVMDGDEAARRLTEVRRVNRLSARSGAWVTASVLSIAVLAIGVVDDLDLVWSSGSIVLGVVGLWVGRPLRSRSDRSDRVGAWLVGGGGALAVVAYIGVQLPVPRRTLPEPEEDALLAAACPGLPLPGAAVGRRRHRRRLV
jgi:hypothetical protein